ncbi:hypothetical protein CF595_09070 [Gallibacterium anatis]|nr:hypothetical protein CF595_09070 [Gallibacterium anatis]
MKINLISDLIEKIEYYHYLCLAYQYLRHFAFVFIFVLNLFYPCSERTITTNYVIGFVLFTYYLYIFFLERKTNKKLNILFDFFKNSGH